jgi:diguanylate cyclase (GGDEF)-like protein
MFGPFVFCGKKRFQKVNGQTGHGGAKRNIYSFCEFPIWVAQNDFLKVIRADFRPCSTVLVRKMRVVGSLATRVAYPQLIPGTGKVLTKPLMPNQRLRPIDRVRTQGGEMAERLKKIISLKISLSDLQKPRAVYLFVGKMIFLAISLAILVSLVVIYLANTFGLLPIPFHQALAYSIVMSWLVGGVVTVVLSMIAGSVIERLSQSHAEFEMLSRTDTLSGLLNRRAFDEIFQAIDGDASLAIFDLDRFKSINDRHGHSAGDVVIRDVATAISAVFAGHTVARLGGEEFAVIICGGLDTERLALVEQARLRVASMSILFEDGEVNTTVSVGVAEIEPGRRKEKIFTSADRALYLAKAAGRNRALHENDVPVANAGDGADLSFSAPSAIRIAPVDQLCPAVPRVKYDAQRMR